jgi:hypothetical protein
MSKIRLGEQAENLISDTKADMFHMGEDATNPFHDATMQAAKQFSQSMSGAYDSMSQPMIMCSFKKFLTKCRCQKIKFSIVITCRYVKLSRCTAVPESSILSNANATHTKYEHCTT